jgi:hypothetical protein
MNREMLQSTTQVGEWYVLLFALLIIDCDISILFKLASLPFIPDSEVYQGIANQISLFRQRSKWS